MQKKKEFKRKKQKKQKTQISGKRHLANESDAKRLTVSRNWKGRGRGFIIEKRKPQAAHGMN